MRIFDYTDLKTTLELLSRPTQKQEQIEPLVNDIFADIRKRGDEALAEYTLKFDGASPEAIKVSSKEIKEAKKKVKPELKEAIDKAIENIELFHASQKIEPKMIGTMPGIYCWQKGVPIEKVGLYIPGGSAPLFSSVLMLAVPARVAGCKEIIICTPPDSNGNINPVILYAASVTGVTKIFKAGGIQAVGAMAYGTKSVPKVDKIFGPGNQYVTTAKQIAAKEGMAIDLPAGPSEVMIVADESAEPAFIAADMLSQAEHGGDSQSVLLTASKQIAEAVKKEINRQKENLSRRSIIEESLEYAAAIIVPEEKDLVDVMNDYAPEHLILSVKDPEGMAEKVVNAGSVFLGNYSPESVGDYASGTNHTLPTNGFAKGWSGVSLDSFLKKITFQKVSEAGLKKIGPYVELMAEAEELDAHMQAVRIRQRTKS
ncbi:MAG: histidinol dehydrogenase [Bacteroidales bacterium]|nr:histidinol dehydrogenase [Bacteroidales bacterium]